MINFGHILYYTLLYCTILYYTVLYITVLYYTILYITILYCTILYSPGHWNDASAELCPSMTIAYDSLRCMYTYTYIYTLTCMCVYIYIYICIHVFAYLFICVFVYLSICVFVCLFIILAWARTPQTRKEPITRLRAFCRRRMRSDFAWVWYSISYHSMV